MDSILSIITFELLKTKEVKIIKEISRNYYAKIIIFRTLSSFYLIEDIATFIIDDKVTMHL